jgi:hypothetical protein
VPRSRSRDGQAVSRREVPHLASNVAEPGVGAQRLGIGEDQRGPVLFCGLREVRVAAGSFGPIEANTEVRVVAERFVRRLSASAQGALPRRVEPIALAPVDGVAVSVGDDGLTSDRDRALDQIRAIASDRYLHAVNRVHGRLLTAWIPSPFAQMSRPVTDRRRLLTRPGCA